jgi:hypothetical protein
MPPFVFHAEQFVPRPLAEVFDFFSKAENLQELTPAFLHFRILSVDPAPIRKGTLIKYSLRWRIFPIRWTTEIIEWEPPNRFVDVQLKGSIQAVASRAPVCRRGQWDTHHRPGAIPVAFWHLWVDCPLVESEKGCRDDLRLPNRGGAAAVRVKSNFRSQRRVDLGSGTP